MPMFMCVNILCYVYVYSEKILVGYVLHEGNIKLSQSPKLVSVVVIQLRLQHAVVLSFGLKHGIDNSKL